MREPMTAVREDLDDEAPSRKRAGVQTGMLIERALRSGRVDPPTVRGLADALRLDETYVRRACNFLVERGWMTAVPARQRGTPNVMLYFLNDVLPR